MLVGSYVQYSVFNVQCSNSVNYRHIRCCIARAILLGIFSPSYLVLFLVCRASLPIVVGMVLMHAVFLDLNLSWHMHAYVTECLTSFSSRLLDFPNVVMLEFQKKKTKRKYWIHVGLRLVFLFRNMYLGPAFEFYPFPMDGFYLLKWKSWIISVMRKNL